MKKVTMLTIVYLSILKVNACSYTAGTFTWKTISSDLIVKAKVLQVGEFDEELKINFAKLKIETLLKGEPIKDIIEIHIDLQRTCPGPAMYKKGDLVITFLKKNVNDNIYSTNTNYHGVKVFKNGNASNLFAKTIIELVRIQKIENGKRRTKEMIDWAIECSKKKETRHIASEEFSYRGFYYKYDRNSKDYIKAKHTRLSKRQRNELKEVLFSIRDFNNNDSVFLGLIAKKRDRKLVELAISHLAKYNRKRPIWYREFSLMKFVVEITKRRDLEIILDEIERIALYSKDMKLNSLTEEFIAKF